ncbi:hypothetical protein B0O80DRAFT_226185 [Mortierella sp. GBAus27b]|nr:hypothetical protein B0O80DRAFT_226185 [Mortierella sp. GBAus27b]
MADGPAKKSLSSKLLTMKFMQRQLEKETREKLEQDQVRVITEAHWVLDQESVDLPKPFQVEYEPSFLQMDADEQSSIGRVSFQQFNSGVETSAAQQDKDQQLEREIKREREGEIDDDDMAQNLGRGRYHGPTKKVKTEHAESGLSGSSGSSSTATNSGRGAADAATGKKSRTNRRQQNSKPAHQPKSSSSGSNGGDQQGFMKPKE